MTSPVFVDTGYLIASVVADDPYAAAAEVWFERTQEERTPLVVSSAILTEFGDGFAKVKRWGMAHPVIDALLDDPAVSVVTVDLGILRRAVALRNQHRDKSWGITDCTSFVIMKDRAITTALACDRHFVQAGFRALLIE